MDGPVSDYNRGIYYTTIAWVLTVIALVVVAIRIYSRAFLTRSLGSDDFAILVSVVSRYDQLLYRQMHAYQSANIG